MAMKKMTMAGHRLGSLNQKFNMSVCLNPLYNYYLPPVLSSWSWMLLPLTCGMLVWFLLLVLSIKVDCDHFNVYIQIQHPFRDWFRFITCIGLERRTYQIIRIYILGLFFNNVWICLYWYSLHCKCLILAILIFINIINIVNLYRNCDKKNPLYYIFSHLIVTLINILFGGANLIRFHFE